MSVKEGVVQFRLDSLKWILVVLLLIAGIAANHHYGDVAWAVRTAIGIVVLAVLLLIISQTAKGQVAWGFFKSARTELRKVVWPTRPEAIQTTLIVAAMVIVVSLILWGVDTLFMWLVTLITQ